MTRIALWSLFVLFLINTMNFFDRQILGAVGESVKEEFGLSDTELGWLGTAFTLLYAVVGLPFGLLADRVSRRWILSAGVTLWSVLTAASGIAQSFRQLFAIRLGVGVGEASCAPAATSLIADLFPSTRRAWALSVFMMGLPIGLGMSLIAAAELLRHFSWRTPFFVACVPGLILAVVVLWIKEPKRGASEHTSSSTSAPPKTSEYVTMLATPTVWWLIASGALHNFNMYSAGAFLVPMLIRFHGMGPSEACWLVAFAYGLSGIPGLFLGGWTADWLRTKRVDGRLIVGAASIVVAIPFTYFAFSQPQGYAITLGVLFGVGCAFMYVYYSSVYATLQDVVQPKVRGTAMALYFFAMYVFGASAGPLVTGFVSDHFAMESAVAAGVLDGSAADLPAEHKAEGIRKTMFLIPAINVALAAVLVAACFTVRRDVERVKTKVDLQIS